MPNQPKYPLTAYRIPTELKEEFIAVAKSKGMSQQAAIRFAMQLWIDVNS
jgi:antitoxin component of RelBE/YafQ-DinJ toxin-antitoxin module